MKTQGCFCAIVAGVALLSVPIVPAADAPGTALAYHFEEARTNAYRVTVESPSENNPMLMEGTIVVGMRPGDKEGGSIFVRGMLTPKQNPQGRRPNMPFARPMGPFGHQNPWAMEWRMMPMPPFNEAQLDKQGRALRLAGMPNLPRPLEHYVSLLFPPLPADGKEFRSEMEMMLDEINSGRHMPMGGFHHGPGGAAGRVAGTRTEVVQVAEKKDGQVRLNRTIEFKSWLQTDDQPRLAYSSKGDFIVDAKDGFLKSATLDGTASIATLDMIQRNPVKVQIERLEGDELEQAITKSGLNRPEKIDDADFEKILVVFEGDDSAEKIEAAQKLLATDLPKNQAERLLPIMEPLLQDPDHGVRMLAARTLSKAAKEEHVPMLLKMLKQEDNGHHYEAIQALGRLRDKRAVEPLTEMIAHGANASHAAADALAEFGSTVEDAALELLKEKHADTKRHACRILQRVGTARSIEPLQALIGNGDPMLIHDLTEALRQIRTRGEEAAKLVF